MFVVNSRGGCRAPYRKGPPRPLCWLGVLKLLTTRELAHEPADRVLRGCVRHPALPGRTSLPEGAQVAVETALTGPRWDNEHGLISYL